MDYKNKTCVAEYGELMEQEEVSSTGKGALFVLFMVTMIDMIGFGIIIPFLTYLVKDLAEAKESCKSDFGSVC